MQPWVMAMLSSGFHRRGFGGRSWSQCSSELGKQFCAHTFHISTVKSVYDPL